MKLGSIFDYLADEGVAVANKSLFIQDLPARAAPTSVMLKNSLNGTDIDYELPNYRRGSFQAIIRCKATSFEEGEALADLVSTTLTIEEKRLGNLHFKYLRPTSEPIAYQLSDGANYEFSVNFSAVYVIVV